MIRLRVAGKIWAMTGGTPATMTLDKAQVAYTLHPYSHDDRSDSYGNEAAAALGVDPRRIFKTLIASVDGRLVCGVVPVAGKLNLKALAAAAGGKKAEMAEPARAQRATGYVLGGISPLGHKTRIGVIIDSSAADLDTIYVSAGKRGLQVELSPADLAGLTGARFAAIAAS
jgi:Cys-tRNA(Pro)/Cys-tRNA(Cys) deacylase